MAKAAGMKRQGMRRYVIGEAKVSHELLEAIATSLETSVDALRAPHQDAIWFRRWWTPADPAYAQLKRNLLAALPEDE